MAGLNDLGLSKEKLEGADFDEIPENLGQTFEDPPQPGKYRFRLPTPMDTIWAKVESQKHGERISAIFEDASALQIVQSPGGTANGTMFRTRISNVPRERTKEKILISDMDLLLRALGVTKRPTTNLAYAQELMKFAGKEFAADVEYSYACRDDKDGYWADETGVPQKVEGRHGCGTRYYQRDIAKVPSNPADPQSPLVYPQRVTCGNEQCGASIRAFANLTGFAK